MDETDGDFFRDQARTNTKPHWEEVSLAVWVLRTTSWCKRWQVQWRLWSLRANVLHLGTNYEASASRASTNTRQDVQQRLDWAPESLSLSAAAAWCITAVCSPILIADDKSRWDFYPALFKKSATVGLLCVSIAVTNFKIPPRGRAFCKLNDQLR